LPAAVLKNPDYLVTIGLDNLSRIVGRSVIDDDNLGIRIGLRQRTFDRVPEESRIVVIDDYNRYFQIAPPSILGLKRAACHAATVNINIMILLVLSYAPHAPAGNPATERRQILRKNLGPVFLRESPIHLLAQNRLAILPTRPLALLRRR
jgi:hypothetical protein